MSHLIIIRGPSSAGKTTLARELQRYMGPGTANIGQDHFRRVVLREHDVPGGDNIDFIAHSVRHCLAAAYHVILEGIFYSPHYGAMLGDLLESHPGPSHVFYLDVPLAETMRRHQSDPLAADVPVDKLREWYNAADLLGVPGEIVVDGNTAPDDTLAALLDRIGVVAPEREADPSRFL